MRRVHEIGTHETSPTCEIPQPLPYKRSPSDPAISNSSLKFQIPSFVSLSIFCQWQDSLLGWLTSFRSFKLSHFEELVEPFRRRPKSFTTCNYACPTGNGRRPIEKPACFTTNYQFCIWEATIFSSNFRIGLRGIYPEIQKWLRDWRPAERCNWK